MLTVSHTPGRIVNRKGRQWWVCPGCGQTMGEVRNGRLEILHRGRWLILLLDNPQAQQCPNPQCREWSTINCDTIEAE